ncbi:membrane integrity-associated transporter subunit PqiC [Pseudomaricurvus sp. HS19]|uniref:PqiC family protein n=1 Tax=Pseudomaricurvus sp. HS19 TaxID=2692626 RepID=UPI001369ADAE|nr:PqiC family protein [Pseudomaricurvus sp. HS19]MYM64570.1 hypothetical protein [Pseudomaricurvus sp. HS19]
MIRHLLTAALCLLLSGCLNGPSAPATRYYLLRADTTTAAQPRDLALAEVRLAAYLQQPGLVMVTDGNEILIARHHQWAEPLSQSLPLFLSRQLGADDRLGTDAPPRYQLRIRIDQLHPTTGGDVILVASWELLDRQNGRRQQQHVQLQEALTGDGFDAAIESQKQLLKRLSDTILSQLEATPT